MDGLWLFPHFGRRLRNSGLGRERRDAHGKKRPSRPAAFGLPVFELTPLEQRLFLSFAPSISGGTTEFGTQNYTLNLNSTGSLTPYSWSINWGDGTIDPIAGTATSATHSYADTNQS